MVEAELLEPKIPYHDSEFYQKWFSVETKPIVTLKGHINSVESVAFNPTNSSEVVTGSHDKTIKRWDINSCKCVDTFQDHKEGIWSLQYSQDGNLLLSASPDHSIILFDMKRKKPINILKEHANKVYWAKFNESNTLIASGGEDSKIIVWDMRKQSPLTIIPSEALVIYSIEFSKDGKYMISSDFDGVLKVFETRKFDLIAQTPKMPTENRAYSCNIDFSERSKLKNDIYVGFMDSFLRKWKLDPATQKLEFVKEIQCHLASVKNISMLSDAGLIATSARDGTCRVWNGESLEFKVSMLGHTDNIACSDFAKSGKNVLVATASWDQTANIYKLS